MIKCPDEMRFVNDAETARVEANKLSEEGYDVSVEYQEHEYEYGCSRVWVVTGTIDPETVD